MNKKFLKHYMETNPEGTAQTYIFLVDNQDIALNIVMSGYQALCLVQEDDGYYFSADSFIEEMRSIQFTGSCQSAYHYVTACTVKWMNDKLQTFFKDAGLDGKVGWQLFKEKRSTLANWIIRKKLRNYWKSIFFGLSEIRKKNRN